MNFHSFLVSRENSRKFQKNHDISRDENETNNFSPFHRIRALGLIFLSFLFTPVPANLP